ncbi:MAG: hypothetical protein M1160_03600 [Candidatus Marsarchaeota archaeon]|nr:hypothetical protein [Candidatus Marsarchaeota archaeon]MCL5111929.1 hypothetical protein [Candidatus Marsarchaeota archaeon]
MEINAFTRKGVKRAWPMLLNVGRRRAAINRLVAIYHHGHLLIERPAAA